MKNGCRIFWTDFALKELERTIKYLEKNWNKKEFNLKGKNVSN